MYRELAALRPGRGRHGPVVLRVCRGLVGPHDAEDVWSETFLAALVAHSRLRPDSNVRGWLVTIAYHKAIDRRRSRQRAPVPLGNLSEQSSPDRQPTDLDLWRDLVELPPKRRGAVAYHYLAGLPYAQVAELAGSTETAVRRGRSRQAPWHAWPGGHAMTTPEPLRHLVATYGDTDAEDLARLHARLVEQAKADGLLDVAYRTLDTPVGVLLLAATCTGLVRVAYPNEGHDRVLAQLAERVSPRILHAPARLDVAAREIEEYFTHHRQRFDVPLDLRLAHGFRRSVLDHLREIAYGTTASYATMAAAAGNPKAVRAVGNACAANPLPVIVPCHRAVRSDGTLGGYVGGLDAKRALLSLEATP